MNIPLYQVDAFASALFAGNPAAVCPLEAWLDDSVMQSIAAENNLSETAFFVDRGEHYELRWFTPEREIDLCGHATLASAWVIFAHLAPARSEVAFETMSGRLVVRKRGALPDGLLEMDFPAWLSGPCLVHPALVPGLGREPVEILAFRDYLVVYESEDDIRALDPDMTALCPIDRLGIIATAPGRAGGDADFVSRFFAPGAGIAEDPVTGSAHSALIPYWARRLGKRELHARQLSSRGGELFCRNLGDRVAIAGRAVPYLTGTITLV